MGKINIVEGPKNPEKETRDLSYNEWARRQKDGEMIDIDSVPVCTKCQKPIAFIELVYDTGTNDINKKCSLVTSYIAWQMHRPCFVVFYTVNETGDDLTKIKVKQVRPADGFVVEMTPEEWSSYLSYLHRDHEVICKKQRKEVRAKNEIARGIRMKRKEQWVSEDTRRKLAAWVGNERLADRIIELQAEEAQPDTYEEDEVAHWSGQIADEFMKDTFLTPPDDDDLDNYDRVRNLIVEVMEPVMKKWNRPGGASVPLPVELVVEMRKAGWKVVHSELTRN